MPSLVLGPMLRYAAARDATVWVQTAEPCEVEVLDHRARTFRVGDRHYALVAVEGLEPGTERPYEVRLDGELVWPPESGSFPASVLRTPADGQPLRLAFGSCRKSAPHEPPHTLRRASAPEGLGVDALRALALRAAADRHALPDVLLLLGDQIYADEPSPRTQEIVAPNVVDERAPQDELEDFGEFAVAYWNAWREPALRWLLSTVPTAMIFDDHEISDEWKISQAWVQRMRAQPWFERRVVGGLMSYWIYQHLGNLSPADLATDELLARACAADDAGPLLRDFAREAAHQAGRSRFSFRRDLGRVRLVVLDARCGRELEPGRRRIMSEGEWAWVAEQVAGDYDHLLLASSIPFVVGHGLHDLEAWNERVCDGAWGARAARWAERYRQAANLGHWAAFGRSFTELVELLDDLVTGRLGPVPRSVVALGGDVHHCYLARLRLPGARGDAPPVWQAVCSGLRKPLDPGEKFAIQLMHSAAGRLLGSALARAAGARRPAVTWQLEERPRYENQIATLEIDREQVRLRVETTANTDWHEPSLRTTIERRLA